MSKRLQVVPEDSEYRDRERKLQVVRDAARHAYPAPEIAQVLAEIERGYGGEKEQ